MVLRGVNPAYAFPALRREMDRVFNDVLGSQWLGGALGLPFRGAPSFPAINVWEDGERLYAEAEIPGVTMNDLEIFASGNELTLKGRRKPLEGENLTYHRQERGTGEFTRVITLPADVDANKVEATLRDGVLTLVMPKAEAARARKILVKAQ